MKINAFLINFVFFTAGMLSFHLTQECPNIQEKYKDKLIVPVSVKSFSHIINDEHKFFFTYKESDLKPACRITQFYGRMVDKTEKHMLLAFSLRDMPEIFRSLSRFEKAKIFAEAEANYPLCRNETKVKYGF